MERETCALKNPKLLVQTNDVRIGAEIPKLAGWRMVDHRAADRAGVSGSPLRCVDCPYCARCPKSRGPRQ